MKMNEEYIAEHDIIRRYLKGKLTPEETVEFEEYILDKPELLEQLELDSVFVETLPKINFKVEKSIVDKFNWRKFWYIPASAFASSFALCLIFLADIMQPDTIPASQVVTNNQLVYLGRTRSNEEDRQVVLFAKENNQLILIIQPPAYDENYFKIYIEGPESSVFSTQTKEAKINENGDLTVSIPSPLIINGTYHLHITSAITKHKETISFDIIQK